MAIKKQWTLQMVFNRVWKRFVVNKAPRAVDERNTCRYGGKGEPHCFIGVCITDIYSPDIEGSPINVLAYPIEKLGWIPVLERFKDIPLPSLQNLQYIHDGYYTTSSGFHEYVEERLTSFGKTYGLRIPKHKVVKSA